MDEAFGRSRQNLRQSLPSGAKAASTVGWGVTVIYVTHDQEEAMHLSDRIVVTRAGLVRANREPGGTVQWDRGIVFVASFLGECNLPEGSLDSKGPDRFTCVWKMERASGYCITGDLLREKDMVMVGVRPEHLRTEKETEGL